MGSLRNLAWDVGRGDGWDLAFDTVHEVLGERRRIEPLIIYIDLVQVDVI